MKIVRFIVLCFFAVLVVLFQTSCTKKQMNIIPRSELAQSKQQEIRKYLKKINYNQARKEVKTKYGKKAVPFMIERIMDIYSLGPDYKYPEEYSVASNLILSLGEMKDKSVIPAFTLWLSDKKYRVFRGNVSHAIGELGDSCMIEILREAWDEEMGYLEKGDDQGPWPFSGYRPTRGYVQSMLSYIGIVLYQLGDKNIVGELMKAARMPQGGAKSGYSKISSALTEISGERGMFYAIEDWEQWWKKKGQSL